MNFFQLIYAYIKKNLQTAQETGDSNERKKQWIKIVFGIIIFNTYWGLGKVWSLRLPVTEEVAGSNPVVPAQGQIAQSVEHLSEKQGVGSSILPLATININFISFHR